jgi:DNA-binding response OmpR family regulator
MACRLLYVDDEQDLRMLVQMHLSLEGYDVETAGDGDTALALIQSKPYDIVLLDVYMPRLNGIQVLQYLKKHNMNTRLIMLTGANNPYIVKECARLGASAYLSKPYNFHELIDSIDRVMAA